MRRALGGLDDATLSLSLSSSDDPWPSTSAASSAEQDNSWPSPPIAFPEQDDYWPSTFTLPADYDDYWPSTLPADHDDLWPSTGMSADAPPADEKTKYDAAKMELLQALAKKRTLDKQLAQLEAQLYNVEASYLTETAAHSGGNIIHGFEGYLKNQPGGRKKYEISEGDRIFSSSSSTYKKALELSGEGEESAATGEDQSRMSTPALTTVIVPPAPRSEVLSAAQQKKNRDREYQRKKRAAQRRSTTTPASDDESVSGRKPSKRARLVDDD